MAIRHRTLVSSLSNWPRRSEGQIIPSRVIVVNVYQFSAFRYNRLIQALRMVGGPSSQVNAKEQAGSVNEL